MNKICCIYAIKDKRSDKVLYIGQTKDYKTRKSHHFGKPFRPVDFYTFNEGRDNFEMFILEELIEEMSIEEIRNKEQDYIEKYNTIENGFNKRRSGNYSKGEKRKQYMNNYYNSEQYKEWYNDYYSRPEVKERKRQQTKISMRNRRLKLNIETL